jgi:hypothetical protein
VVEDRCHLHRANWLGYNNPGAGLARGSGAATGNFVPGDRHLYVIGCITGLESGDKTL